MNPTLHGIHFVPAITSKTMPAEAIPSPQSFHAAARVLNPIGDPVRLRILWWLTRVELSVTDLCELLAMSQQAVTHHLNILRLTRLLALHRKGRYHYYRLTDAGQEVMAVATSLIQSGASQPSSCRTDGP